MYIFALFILKCNCTQGASGSYQSANIKYRTGAMEKCKYFFCVEISVGDLLENFEFCNLKSLQS
jgi:hypothetical protein